jgi:hypothetical protein
VSRSARLALRAAEEIASLLVILATIGVYGYLIGSLVGPVVRPL